MPDKLSIHSGERIDVADLTEAANTYTQDSIKFVMEREWLDRRSRILDGFRVRIEDQTSNPGMLTIYNGMAADRNGQLLNNEGLVNDSRSVTLLGASQTFYVEIEFIETQSGTDSRYFWDPTAVNTPPEPNGQEFSINVATRITPDWHIVTPVSTTGFQQTSSPNSIRIPIGVYSTDGTNKISTGVTNPGMTLVNIASVLEGDMLTPGLNSIRVVDARLFPGTLPFNVSVGFGLGSVEAKVVTNIDRANGILTLSTNLANAHGAGEIVKVTGVTADWVQQNADPSSTSAHPDLAQRFWEANELRGSALSASKEAVGTRDDLNLRSMKDYIDFMSAQIRELKFGNLRPDSTFNSPASSFNTRPRYFDKAGSVLGARSNSVSIGNGTTSFGDINTTDGALALLSAVSMLPSTGGTIFWKRGTYTFASTITIDRPVHIVGESQGTTVLQSTNAGGAAINISSTTLSLTNLSVSLGGGASASFLTGTTLSTLYVDRIAYTGQITLPTAGVIHAKNSSFTASGSNAIITGGTLTGSMISCSVAGGNAAAVISAPINAFMIDDSLVSAVTRVASLNNQTLTDLFISNSVVSTTNGVSITAGTGAVSGVYLHNNHVTVTNLLNTGAVFEFPNATVATNHLEFVDNYINITGSSTSSGSPGFVVSITGNNSTLGFRMVGNYVDCVNTSFVVGLKLDQNGFYGLFEVDGLYLNGAMEVARIGGTGTVLSGDLKFNKVYHDNVGLHPAVVGISLVNSSAPDRVTVTNSFFTNYTNNSSNGVRTALNLSTNATARTEFVVDKNVFTNIGGFSTTTAAAVYYVANTASVQPHLFKVTDNTIISVASTDSVSTTAGIIITNIGNTSNTMKVNVSGNMISTIGGNSASVAAGIYVRNVNAVTGHVRIRDNFVSGVICGTAQSGSGLYIYDCSNVEAVGNTVIDCSSVSGASIGVYGCGIRYVNSAAATSNVEISKNVVNQSTVATPANGRHNIIVTNDQTLDSVQVTDNKVVSSTNGQTLIWVAFTTSNTATITNLQVHRNSLTWNSTTADTGGIYITPGGSSVGIAVNENTIRETTQDTTNGTRKGIVVSGALAGGTAPRTVTINSNQLLGVKPAGVATITTDTRIGILVDSVNRANIVGNMVDWLEPDTAGNNGLISNGIRLYSTTGGVFKGFLISGNYIRSTNNTAVTRGEIFLDSAKMTNGLVVGNVYGESANGGTGPTGYLIPNAAAATWVYASNNN